MGLEPTQCPVPETGGLPITLFPWGVVVPDAAGRSRTCRCPVGLPVYSQVPYHSCHGRSRSRFALRWAVTSTLSLEIVRRTAGPLVVGEIRGVAGVWVDGVHAGIDGAGPCKSDGNSPEAAVKTGRWFDAVQPGGGMLTGTRGGPDNACRGRLACSA